MPASRVMTPVFLLVITALSVVRADSAFAQSDPARLELGFQVASTISGEFDASDIGLGGRASGSPGP